MAWDLRVIKWKIGLEADPSPTVPDGWEPVSLTVNDYPDYLQIAYILLRREVTSN